MPRGFHHHGGSSFRAARALGHIAHGLNRAYWYSRPYYYGGYYYPYYYNGGYYGGYGYYPSSRGTKWYVTGAILAFVVAPLCFLLPLLPAIICASVAVLGGIGFTIAGAVSNSNEAAEMRALERKALEKQIETKSHEQSQSQAQNKGNHAEKSPVKYAKPQPKEKQMGTTGKDKDFSGYSVKSGREQKQIRILPKSLKEMNTIKNCTMCSC